MTDLANDNPWFRRYAPCPENGLRLLCFPHAGGSASSFLWLCKKLSPALDAVAVQYPGRQDRYREPHFGTIQQLAGQIVDNLGAVADRPLALFGHSMGAVTAFEVARRLEHTNGTSPVVLFVSGRRAPSVRREDRVHQRDDRGLIAEIKALGGTDSRLLADEEILSMVLPTVRADYRAIETYRYAPGPAVSCPIVALTGDEDPRASIDDVTLWAEHTTGEFDLHVLRGGHFFLNEQPQQVTRVVTERLAGQLASCSPCERGPDPATGRVRSGCVM
ncbi:oleoyl-ACP hydrolase [Longimycelium tulufanense]|uniref:Oleoyl-ACP hydrolase n=1 Tax=Longimycelium tulufanense TaxID=907463 RepID=A0A8J3C9V2_9PSEU|nr:alpha/beta fold hydrolase [Longimycelium tulufanense]GGM33949.1 oleoyl-ACP hydrolase [Longimycelium tulufanense]